MLDQKFQNFVMKQEQTLRVSIYLLLNLSEDIKVLFAFTIRNHSGFLAMSLLFAYGDTIYIQKEIGMRNGMQGFRLPKKPKKQKNK